jgi:Protein of unknown function (DUF3060)
VPLILFRPADPADQVRILSPFLDIRNTVILRAGFGPSVDCRGKGLLVQADSLQLSVRNCSRIHIQGNTNVLSADTLTGPVFIQGDDNEVRIGEGQPSGFVDQGERNRVGRIAT